MGKFRRSGITDFTTGQNDGNSASISFYFIKIGSLEPAHSGLKAENIHYLKEYPTDLDEI